jgi:SNF2 family DNA or RNA helicase
MDVATWHIVDNTLVLKSNGLLYQPTSSEIVGIQFKNKPIKTDGHQLCEKPSRHLPKLKLHRFPLPIRLVIRFSRSRTTKPQVGIIAKLRQSEIKVEDSNYDHLIYENEWHPLDNDSLTDIKKVLVECEVKQLTNITMKQCLSLMKSGSDLIAIEYTDVQGNNSPTTLSEFDTNKIDATLYPYQTSGVNWLFNGLAMR